MNARARALIGLAVLVAFAAIGRGGADAQDIFTGHYPQQSGEAIYTGVCQGCHMPDAMGAVGAGAYPALAKDPRLQSGAYAAMIVIKGQKAMPPFGDSFTDGQIANVVNYLRSNFGNGYADQVTPDQVKTLRPAPPVQ